MLIALDNSEIILVHRGERGECGAMGFATETAMAIQHIAAFARYPVTYATTETTTF